MRALIVEDELLTALHLETELEALNVQSIGIACDRREAMALADALPDIAFIDVNLRDGPTGPDIARELSQKRVIVMFITANPSQIPLEQRSLASVMPKPFSSEDLAAAIAGLRPRRVN